MTVNVILRQVS